MRFFHCAHLPTHVCRLRGKPCARRGGDCRQQAKRCDALHNNGEEVGMHIDHGCDGGRGALWDGWGTKCARVNRPQQGKALDEAKPCVQRVQLPACSRCHAQLASISDSSDRNEESSVNIWLYRPYDTPELTMAGRYDTSASAPTLLSSAIAFL